MAYRIFVVVLKHFSRLVKKQVIDLLKLQFIRQTFKVHFSNYDCNYDMTLSHLQNAFKNINLIFKHV